jgi:hypothetical protein
VTLLVRLDINNQSIQDFYVMPNIEHRNRFTIKMKDAWLDRRELIPSLANFCDALRRVCIHSNALNRLGSTNKLGDLVATASLV